MKMESTPVLSRTISLFSSLAGTTDFVAAIMDPLDREIMAQLKTASMVLGEGHFCMNYLKAVRAGDIAT